MRLVDADMLIKTIPTEEINARMAIATAPTVEAEPIKHGRWIPSDKGDCTYTCSECGFVRDAYILEEKAYCPRCGAKMFDNDIDVSDKNVGKIDEVEND